MTGILISEVNWGSEIQRKRLGDDRDRDGVQLQATAGHRLPAIPAISSEAGREDSAVDLSGGQGSSTVLTSDFWPPDLRKHTPIGLSTPVCGNLSWQLEEISLTFKLPQVNPAHHFPQLPSFLQDTGMCAGGWRHGNIWGLLHWMYTVVIASFHAWAEGILDFVVVNTPVAKRNEEKLRVSPRNTAGHPTSRPKGWKQGVQLVGF